MPVMRWRCQDYGCYLQRRTDTVMFDGCFPAGVGMSDIDGIVELNGHFLVVEFKRSGTRIPVGQWRMFEQLVATGHFRVVIVFALEQHVMSWTWFTPKGAEHREGDVEALREEIAQWSRRHDPRPVVTGPVRRPEN